MQYQKIKWPSEHEKDLKHMTGEMNATIDCSNCHAKVSILLKQAEAGEIVECPNCGDSIQLKIDR